MVLYDRKISFATTKAAAMLLQTRRNPMPFDFQQTDEQRMLVETVRGFIETELYPHERLVDKLGHVPPELGAEIKGKAKALGLYSANMPEEVGGGGLDVM